MIPCVFCEATAVTQILAISKPIREKYVQIFSLQRNISEMSVKTIWEKPMRKDFFTPPQEARDSGKGREKRKGEDRKKAGKAAVNRGGEERRKGWRGGGKEGGGFA